MCLYARELAGLDRLIVSVSKNPFKASADASDEDRAVMTGLLAVEVNSAGTFAETSIWELKQPGPSYTVDLLRHAAELYPGDELVLLVGEDSYRQMSQWKNYRDIPRLCTIAVFGRATGAYASDICGEPLPPANLYDFNMPVSATQVRALVAAGKPFAHLVMPSIAAYIDSHGLYRS